MAISINGVVTDYGFSSNGVEMETASYNGAVELWTRATPWTVNFSDHPLQEVSSYNVGSKECLTTPDYYRVSIQDNSSEDVGSGSLTAKVTLPTQKCNKVKVKCSASYGLMTTSPGTINDVEVPLESETELIFNCTGEEFDLMIKVSDATAYYTASITVTEVSFYYE